MRLTRFTCPHCETSLKFPNGVETGKKSRCPKCKETFVVAPPDGEEKQERVTVKSSAARPAKKVRPQEDDGEQEERAPRKKQGKKGKSKPASNLLPLLIAGCVLLLAGGGVGLYFMFRKEPPRTNNPQSPGPGPVASVNGEMEDPKAPPNKPLIPTVKIAAEELFKETTVEENAAVAKYEGKVIELTGRISQCTNESDRYTFGIFAGKTKTGWDSVYCKLKEDEQERVMWLGAGQKVSVVGKATVTRSGYIKMEECTVTEKEPNPTIRVTAEQLTADFAKGRMTAEEKYLEKPRRALGEGFFHVYLIVTGQVVDLAIQDGPFNKEHVANLAGKDGMTVSCVLTEKVWSSLKKGDKVTIKGKLNTLFNENKKRVRIAWAFVLKGSADKDAGSLKGEPPSSVDATGLIASSGFNGRKGLNAGPGSAPFPLDVASRPGGEGEPGWATPWTASPNTVFQSAVVHEGDGALRIKGTQGCRRVLANPQAGRFQIEQYLYLAPGGDFVCYLRKNGDDSDVGLMWRAEKGKFRVHDGDKRNGPGRWMDTGFAYEPNTWYKVTVRIDVPQNTWEFLVNDKPFAAPQPLGFRTRQPSLDQIDYGSFGPEGFYLDAVRVLPWPVAGKEK